MTFFKSGVTQSSHPDHNTSQAHLFLSTVHQSVSFTFWRGEDGEDGHCADGEVEGEDRAPAEASYDGGEAAVAGDFHEGAKDHVKEGVLAVEGTGKS